MYKIDGNLLIEIIEKAKSLNKSIALGSDKEDSYSKSLELVLLLLKMEEAKDSKKLLGKKEEIEKVKRKVPKWNKNSNQINSKILNCYLQLKKEDSKITTSELEKFYEKTCGKNSHFKAHFAQMHNISEKNHAKVFDVENSRITLWSPVSEFIESIWLIK